MRSKCDTHHENQPRSFFRTLIYVYKKKLLFPKNPFGFPSLQKSIQLLTTQTKVTWFLNQKKIHGVKEKMYPRSPNFADQCIKFTCIGALGVSVGIDIEWKFDSTRIQSG